MKWLRSDFSKVHAVVMLVALVNITMGFMMAFSVIPFNIASELHEVAGLMLLPIILLLLSLYTQRKKFIIDEDYYDKMMEEINGRG